jgi:thiazolylpeptide-type bacteriocin precursor
MDLYRQLQKHLDKMPVGFPKTKSGIEIKILKRYFTPKEAELALCLDHTEKSAADVEAIYNGVDNVSEMLENIAQKGVINSRIREGERKYNLIPYVIGMYEMQVKNPDHSIHQETSKYFKESFGLEYLTTAVPQMRVIPVERSVKIEHRVATYDEIRDIIEKAGDRIGITECICKKGKRQDGTSCKKTDNIEVCFGLRDMFDTYHERGWGRKITKDEAFEILDYAEKKGLVLQPSNEQEPQFVCACCSCCCGIFATIKMMKRPADFVASNFYAAVDNEKCNDCDICLRRCSMDAISKNGKVTVDLGKCIGCGICVSRCKPGALTLVKKEKDVIPPMTEEEKYQYILDNKKSKLGKIATGVKGLMGVKVNQYR